MNHLKYGNLEIDPKKIHESTQVQVTMEKHTGTFTESTDGAPFLLPRIEAIHAGSTRNNTRYLRDKLRGDAEIKSGVYSWLHPYPKPVIYNHDVNTNATGRIYTAAFAEYTQAGRPGIITVPKITDPVAIAGIQGKRLLTVSIGAETDSVTCSICGTDIVNEGYCGHMKGETYDGITAEWIAGNLWFDELSWVNVPADSDAMIVDTQSSVLIGNGTTESKSGIITLGKESFSKHQLVGLLKESADDIVLMEGELDMTEEQIQALKEELEALKGEKTALEEQVATAKEATSALEEEKNVLVEENTSLKEANQVLTDDKEKVVTEMDELKSSATSLQEELEGVKSQLEEKTAVAEQLEVKKAELEEAIADAKAKLEESQLAQEELVANVKESHVNHLATLRVLTGKEDTYATAKESLVESELDSLKEAVSGIEEEIGAFKESEGSITLRDKVTFGEDVKKQEEGKQPLSDMQVLYNLFTGK